MFRLFTSLAICALLCLNIGASPGPVSLAKAAALGSITATILDSKGQPSVGTKVSLAEPAKSTAGSGGGGGSKVGAKSIVGIEEPSMLADGTTGKIIKTAMTSDKGIVEFKGLKPGLYTVLAGTMKTGRVEEKIQVDDGKSAVVTVTLPVPKK